MRTVHPPSTRERRGPEVRHDSGQADLRHTERSAESCFLPDLTRFAGLCCAGPGPRRRARDRSCGVPSLGREFSPPCVDWRYREPRAPRLARSAFARVARASHIAFRTREGCESGRIGTLGKRVWGNSPWVRIPLPPPLAVCAGQSRSATAARGRRDTHVTQRISLRDARGPRGRRRRGAGSRLPRARGTGARTYPA